jgi:hypothetical protein
MSTMIKLSIEDLCDFPLPVRLKRNSMAAGNVRIDMDGIIEFYPEQLFKMTWLQPCCPI